DVDDRDIGLVGADLAQQILGVGRLADDLDPGLVEQACYPLPQQDRVLADHDSHGITALSLVPPPAGPLASSPPPSAGPRAGTPGPAPRGPSSATSTTSEPSASVTPTSARLAPSAWRATLVRPSATTK